LPLGGIREYIIPGEKPVFVHLQLRDVSATSSKSRPTRKLRIKQKQGLRYLVVNFSVPDNFVLGLLPVPTRSVSARSSLEQLKTG
jgi:hypothetical protein